MFFETQKNHVGITNISVLFGGVLCMGVFLEVFGGNDDDGSHEETHNGRVGRSDCHTNSIPKWVALKTMRDAIFLITTQDASKRICIVISFRCCPRTGPGLNDHHAFRFGGTIVAHHRGQFLKDIIGEWPALII